MTQIYVHRVGSEYIVVTTGTGGQIMSIPDTKSAEIEALIEERRRIGRELSLKLKEAGLVTAADDDDTVVTFLPLAGT